MVHVVQEINEVIVFSCEFDNAHDNVMHMHTLQITNFNNLINDLRIKPLSKLCYSFISSETFAIGKTYTRDRCHEVGK